MQLEAIDDSNFSDLLGIQSLKDLSNYSNFTVAEQLIMFASGKPNPSFLTFLSSEDTYTRDQYLLHEGNTGRAHVKGRTEFDTLECFVTLA